MKNIFLLILIVFGFMAFKPNPAYQIFSSDKEKQIDFDKMMKDLEDADVIFFGETHDNSICHWLELQVLKSLDKTTRKDIIVGAEMFESDDQLILDEYMSDLIKEEHFVKEAKVWDNYKTDYAPMVNFAKEHKYKFVATNVPRRYANLVARNGLESLNKLDKSTKKYIAPLPIKVDYQLSSYKEIADMMADHKGANFMVDAQAIKDATMAYFIAENMGRKSVFYHFNGAFHSDHKQGIVDFLQKAQPKLKIMTITMVDQDDIQELEKENIGLADFIIAIPSDMTKTY